MRIKYTYDKSNPKTHAHEVILVTDHATQWRWPHVPNMRTHMLLYTMQHDNNNNNIVGVLTNTYGGLYCIITPGTAMLINNNYVIIMFIGCPGATFFLTFVCIYTTVVCGRRALHVWSEGMNVRRRENKTYINPFVKPTPPPR